MLSVAEHAAVFTRELSQISISVKAALHIRERTAPGAFFRTFEEGVRALKHGSFESYEPIDLHAWELIAVSVRSGFDFEVERIHLLAAVVRSIGDEMFNILETRFETEALKGRTYLAA